MFYTLGRISKEGYCIGLAGKMEGTAEEVGRYQDGFIRVLYPNGSAVKELDAFARWKDCEQVVIKLNELVEEFSGT